MRELAGELKRRWGGVLIACEHPEVAGVVERKRTASLTEPLQGGGDSPKATRV
jgi:hypothetical protein